MDKGLAISIISQYFLLKPLAYYIGLITSMWLSYSALLGCFSPLSIRVCFMSIIVIIVEAVGLKGPYSALNKVKTPLLLKFTFCICRTVDCFSIFFFEKSTLIQRICTIPDLNLIRIASFLSALSELLAIFLGDRLKGSVCTTVRMNCPLSTFPVLR